MKWHRQLAAWTVPQNSLCVMVHPSSSAFWSRITGRHFFFLWSRNYEGLAYLVLAKLGSQPPYIVCSVCTVFCLWWEQGHSLAQWLSCHNEAKSIRRFSDAHHWSGMRVLPGADLSHCQKQLNKISLNIIFCWSLRVWRLFIHLSIHNTSEMFVSSYLLVLFNLGNIFFIISWISI